MRAMKTLKPGKRVTVKVPASASNLGPGFDCLGLALSLYNTTEFEVLSNGALEISIIGEGADTLPRGDYNTVYRAFMCTRNLFGIKPVGLRITQHNRIPISRGLGSSAAAVISGILAADSLFGTNLDTDTMLTLALDFEKHPDCITPCLVGGMTISRITGNKVLHLSIKQRPKLKVVLMIPDLDMPVDRSREVLPKEVPLRDAVFNLSSSSLVVASFCRGDYGMLAQAMEDRLHQCARMSLMPYMCDCINAARSAGAVGASLCGQGSSILAFADARTAQVAQAMKKAVSNHGIDCKTIVCEVDITGPKVK